MKVAYLIDEDINRKSGILNKINQQISIWRKKGVYVYKIFMKNGIVLDNKDKIIIANKKINKTFSNKNRLATFINIYIYHLNAYFILKKLKFDIIYTRYNLYTPFFPKILKKYKSVMEINSDDSEELKLRSIFTHKYNEFTRDEILSSVNGFICVSKELGKLFKKYNKPIEVIANGINVKDYPFKPQTNNKNPKIVFIGASNQRWHGLDKIIYLSEILKNYEFNIIGLVGKNTSNLKYLGYMDLEKANEIISNADIGISTLSLYEKNLTEASPLKTRHYAACGIPFIYAYNDTDLSGNEKFALKLGNRRNNLDIKKIKDFINFSFQNLDLRKETRLFAENILDLGKKEEKRLKFFERILYE